MLHPGATGSAFSTRVYRVGYNGIADSKTLDLGPQCGNYPCSFMAKRKGKGRAKRVGGDVVQIGGADCRGACLDQHLVIGEVRQGTLDQRHLIERLQDDRSHLSGAHEAIPKRTRLSRSKMPSIVTCVTCGNPLLPMI